MAEKRPQRTTQRPHKDHEVPQAPVAWNSSSTPRLGPKEFHEKNLADGMVYFLVDMNSDTTPERNVTLQNKIKALDDKANKMDERTGRRIPYQKPYFKYTSIQADGTEKTFGGGLYLYSGWSETDEPRFHRNSKEDLKGKKPVYFRAKSGVQNSKVPNFSIQWEKVHMFYYKFPAEPSTVIKVDGNKKIVYSPGN